MSASDPTLRDLSVEAVVPRRVADGTEGAREATVIRENPFFQRKFAKALGYNAAEQNVLALGE